MGNFIEEFYYGNLDPQACSTKENKAVQKQMEVLMLNEDFLKLYIRRFDYGTVSEIYYRRKNGT